MVVRLLEVGRPPYYAAVAHYSIESGALTARKNARELPLWSVSHFPGNLGVERVEPDGLSGLVVSYWRSIEDIEHWHDHPDYRAFEGCDESSNLERLDSYVIRITRAYGPGGKLRTLKTDLKDRFSGPIAVIFSSSRTAGQSEAYEKAADTMAERAAAREGYLDLASLRDENGFGITISFWRDLAAAAEWKSDPVHREIQKKGRALWYEDYRVRAGRVLSKRHRGRKYGHTSLKNRNATP